MNPALYLSCLVVAIGCLVWTVSAQQDFETDRTRLINAYKDASPDSISDANVHLLVEFLDKHGDQFELTPEQRERAANAVRQYKEERASQPLVDGVPPQGGRLVSTSLVKSLQPIIDQINQLVAEAMKIHTIQLAAEAMKKDTAKD